MRKKDKILKEFLEQMETQGKNCGEIIGAYLKERHPKAIVICMYRSAIAFEHNIKDYNIIDLYACGDPHSMGGELNVEMLDKWTNHLTIEGDRFGPKLNNPKLGEDYKLIFLSYFWSL